MPENQQGERPGVNTAVLEAQGKVTALCENIAWPGTGQPNFQAFLRSCAHTPGQCPEHTWAVFGARARVVWAELARTGSMGLTSEFLTPPQTNLIPICISQIPRLFLGT